ncbi:MAG TPA: metallophosphoesterase [Longimicrobiales bacterium]|nr:metallophosphoesterase [Longimicrobiales bacterium]
MTTTFRRLALAVGGAAAATAAYAVLVEPRWLHRTRPRLHFPDLPPALEGLTIALVTDIHAGGHTPRGVLARAVRLVMDARPDLIAVSGDLAEDEASLEAALDALAELAAPLGVYVVPGNHDYRDVGIERWHDAVGRRQSPVDLTNRVRFLRVGGEGEGGATLCVAGVDDLAHGRPNLAGLSERHRDFTILLAHHPDQAERARRSVDRVDLILSGHTHGGQVRLPGLGAIVNSAASPHLYEAGVRRRPWTQVYTSRGIGTTHLPVRFLSRPELPVLTLTSAPRPPRRVLRGW